MACKILVIEDEALIREMLTINLVRAGFDTFESSNGEDGIDRFNSLRPDVVLLDINLPGMDGFEVCRRIRERNATAGIIMLTARSQEFDRIEGLRSGADDYITKPFSPGELIARVEALVRRLKLGTGLQGNKAAKDVISGPFCLSLAHRTLSKNGEEVDITQTEYQILAYLMQNEGETLSRKDIFEHAWPYGKGDLKIVDVNVRRLRMKLEDDPSEPVHLKTVWGVGYRWCSGEAPR